MVNWGHIFEWIGRRGGHLSSEAARWKSKRPKIGIFSERNKHIPNMRWDSKDEGNFPCFWFSFDALSPSLVALPSVSASNCCSSNIAINGDGENEKRKLSRSENGGKRLISTSSHRRESRHEGLKVASSRPRRGKLLSSLSRRNELERLWVYVFMAKQKQIDECY